MGFPKIVAAVVTTFDWPAEIFTGQSPSEVRARVCGVLIDISALSCHISLDATIYNHLETFLVPPYEERTLALDRKLVQAICEWSVKGVQKFPRARRDYSQMGILYPALRK